MIKIKRKLAQRKEEKKNLACVTVVPWLNKRRLGPTKQKVLQQQARIESCDGEEKGIQMMF